MGKTRNLTKLEIDSNGDVAAGSLDNVPPSDDASALTTGTLDIARIADGAVTAGKLASTLDLTGKTVTLPSGTGGKVLQVVQATKNDVTSTTSGSYVDITGMSVSITPSSASNKVLVMFSVTVGNSAAGRNDCVRLVRNSTAIAVGTGAAIINTTSYFRQDSIAIMTPGSMTFLDSPATTSATTYKLQWLSEGGGVTLYLNRRGNDTNYITFSTITAMEIAA